jgi:cation diffusion facilitator CzcD-associated flavoprotein CzcO
MRWAAGEITLSSSSVDTEVAECSTPSTKNRQQNREEFGMPDPAGIRKTVIIGAGFGGIGMAIRLKRSGVDDFVILERAAGVGGVWFANSYPGAACDVESHLYSYSFETNFDWERPHGNRSEILRYFEHCLRKYDLLKHIKFNKSVAGAEFDEASGTWIVRTADGETLRTKTLISACGLFNSPSIPHLSGIETFKGAHFHSAQWDAAFDPRGKKIAVIGTGCSAAQFVPEIVGEAAKLTVFQRTPAFVGPRQEAAFTDQQRRLYRLFPILRQIDRLKIFYRYEQNFRVQEEPELRKVRGKDVAAFITSQVSNEAKRAKLLPPYEAGCKRNVRSGTFLKALDRPNADVITSGIDHVTTDAIVTKDGASYPVDTIIYGTGFTPSNYLSTFQVRGLDGQDLRDAWKDGPEAYLGIGVSGFPNFFMIYGPNTNAPASIIFMIECQINYILKCLRAIEKKKLRYMDVASGVQTAFNKEVQSKLKATSWASGCTSYFMTAAGKIVTQWPGASHKYWLRTRKLDLDDYRMIR